LNRSEPLSLFKNWKATWASASQRTLMLTGSAVVSVILSAMPFFFKHIEQRPGIQIHDFVLSRLPAHNVSLFIFLIIWSMGLLTLVRAIQTPAVYVRYVWLYILICLTRLLTITLVPLAPPAGWVELVDPLTGIFYGHSIVTKDLFYSGHTATLVAMYFCLPKKSDRILVVLATIVVGCLLLVQHIHYTIDVLAAPVFVYLLNQVVKSTLFVNKNLNFSK
jgi:hypothetical protein